MKIAYVNEIPAMSQLQQFVQTYTSEVNEASHSSIFGITHAHYVISAVDGQQLIGCGYINEQEGRSRTHIYVAAAYRERGIGRNIEKLLYAERKFSPLTAAN